MAIRVSGLISGLDTDSIVQELVSAYATKKDKYTKAQTKLEWKMDAWKSMNSKIYGFYTTSLSNMRLTTNYSLKTSSVSDSSVAKVTASSTAVSGTQSLKVKELASSAYMTGGVVSNKTNPGEKVTGSTLLTDIGAEAGGVISIGDTKINIEAGTTVNNLIGQLKEAGYSANFDETNQRIFLSSNTEGAAGEFTLMADNAAGLSTLQAVGLFAVKDVNGEETAEMAKYRELAANNDGSEAYYVAKSVVDMVDAGGLTADEISDLEAIVEPYEENLAIVREYEAAQAAIAKFEEQQQIVTDYAATIDTYLDKLTKEKKTDDTGAESRVLYTDEELAKMKEYNEANANSTDADVIQKIEENKSILEAKEIYDKYEAAKAYTTNADNIAAKDEATALVNNADSTAAYNTAKAYVEDSSLKDNYVQAKSLLNGNSIVSAGSDVARVSAQDAVIELNGATFTSANGSFSINGLSITALEETGDEAVTITTAADSQAVYDKIKEFISKYNELLTDMDTAYNAASSGDYEPLTEEEQESMTDKQIEKWETKIKDALLRRDSTLGGVSSSMKAIMQSSFEIDGKMYSLSNFGINTLSYFEADVNERGCWHIDGDTDDSHVAGTTDKLMAAINSDPDTVVSFFQQLSTKLYNDLTKRMASSSTSSAYTVYNDKQMSKEYSEYNDVIDKWEEKLEYYEDYYYSKFAAMEKALSQLQSSTSALGGLLGTGTG